MTIQHFGEELRDVTDDIAERRRDLWRLLALALGYDRIRVPNLSEEGRAIGPCSPARGTDHEAPPSTR